MNQTFDIKRFSLLFVKHTADHYKTYLMSFFVLLGVLFLGMGFAAYVSAGNLSDNTQIPFFIFFLLIAGTIFTSIVFSDLGEKKKAISMLTLPASHFEKYLVSWLYSFVIFLVLFVPSFYLVVIIIQQLASLGDEREYRELMTLFDTEHKVYIVFFLYAVLHAVSLLGSIIFEKYHFIKTAFIFFIGVFSVTFFNNQILKILISKNVNSGVPFNPISVQERDLFYMIRLPQDTNTYFLLVIVIVVLILWACSFYRLKEKEV